MDVKVCNSAVLSENSFSAAYFKEQDLVQNKTF